MLFRRLTLAVVLSAICSPAWADVKPASIFTDNMVLQQEMPVPVWGTAAAGEKVTVTFGDAKAEATADADGKWMVKLPALKPGDPRQLVIAGQNTVTLSNVLVGEVWICSGQSNMAFPVAHAKDGKKEVAEAKYPEIRLLFIPKGGAPAPAKGFKGAGWQVCSPQTVTWFSAVGYFFGREIHKDRKVPVGLIDTSVGGTPIEAWTSAKALNAPAAPAAPPAAPATAPAKRSMNTTSGLYNAMIAPLAPYAIRGAIWYQGESNAAKAEQYQKLLPAMIADWRSLWGEGDFPFLIVQLANYQAAPKSADQPSAWAALREAQTKALSVPNTGMAVIIDIGDAGNIHPTNKQEVGWRLSLAARAIAYGEKIVYSGPMYESMKVEGDKIRVQFQHVGGGLVAKGGKLTGFAIAGADRKFVWADAVIDGQTVVVCSPEVNAPVAVRYGWANNPACNLYNAEGLPAGPFRTDDWKPAPEPPKAASQPATKPAKTAA